MSVQAISWVIEHSKQKGNGLVVLLMIANHAKSDGTGAWPSIRTLAKEARIGDRTVQRVIRLIAKSGELRVKKGDGPYGTNLYELPGVKLAPPVSNRAKEGCQIGPSRGVTAMSPNPSLTVLKDKDKTPLPPTSVGEENYFVWRRETIGVRMGRRRRLPGLASFDGAQAERVVDFLNQKGFPARIVRTQ